MLIFYVTIKIGGKMKINENIFRQYDIRGVYPIDIDETFAYLIGRSYGSYIKEKYNYSSCVIGYDNRISSAALKDELTKGLIESGCHVTSIGLCTTPMLYYARYIKKIPGIMITASHNSKEENGFKFSFDPDSNARGEMIDDFKKYTLEKKFINGNGSINYININDDYYKYLQDNVKMGKRPLKVVYDPGNGVGSTIVKPIHDYYNNLDNIYICSNSDGTFPHHHPDPSVEENLDMLKQAVLENKADIGISYDGDADRIGFIDELGNFIPVDYIIAIFANYLIPNLSNKTILFDIKCSKTLEDEIIKSGGTTFMYRTGASYTQTKVYEDNLSFGGEYSGHLYFNDRIHPNSCGIYAGLRMLEILSNTDKKLSELIKDFTKYKSIPEVRVPCDDNYKFRVVANIKNYCLQKQYIINDIDGVRVTFDDGWALVRASNTGPNLTLRFEAINEQRLKEIENEFNTLVENNIKALKKQSI